MYFHGWDCVYPEFRITMIPQLCRPSRPLNELTHKDKKENPAMSSAVKTLNSQPWTSKKTISGLKRHVFLSCKVIIHSQKNKTNFVDVFCTIYIMVDLIR